MRVRRGKQVLRALSGLAFPRGLGIRCALWVLAFPLWLQAADHHASFDGPKTEWTLSSGGQRPRIDRHDILTGPDGPREGTGAELFQLTAGHTGTDVEFVCPVPPTLRLDETRLSLWVRSTHPSVAVYCRLRFPNQIDPRTNQPLVADIPGTRYELTAPQWKKLECRPDDRAFQQVLQRLRHLLLPQLKQQSDLETRDVYVEAVVIKSRIDAGSTAILFDDLTVGPVVPLQGSQAVERAVESEPAGKFSRIRIGDNRITKDGRPFVPLFVPYHHETVEQFQETGANVAWVERYDDEVLLREFAAKGIGVTASPPRLAADADQQGLPPFGAATAPIDFWMLDVRIPGTALPEVTDWIEQVRDADQQHPRPILADVTGREREFHRELSLLGSSRFILGSMQTPRELGDHLERKQRLSLPGKGMFTLVPLEPADDLQHDPAQGPRIEPEQVFLLGNTALTAGYKAIGYWNRNPLSEETRHALKLMNLHVRLLEPWLATGKVAGTAPIQIGPDRGMQGAPTAAGGKSKGKLPSSIASRWDTAMRVQPTGRLAQVEQEIRATVIDSEFGMLVIVNWLEENGQFQPGRMAVDDLHLFVKRDVQKAWTLTATKIEPVTLKQVPGGTEITLRKFDQFAYILISHEREVYDAVERQIQQIRRSAAESWIELATLKLARVRDVHRQIEFVAPAVRDASLRFDYAESMLDQARENLKNGSCNGAQEYSRAVLALTRDIQRKHWENAVARFSSPVANPHTAAFQSLPQHWHMMARLGSGPPHSQTLLTVRGFESLDQMVAEGWSRREGDLPDTIRTAVELRPAGATGRSCLRLAAGTGAPLGSRDNEAITLSTTGPYVQLQSPVLVAQPGQLIHVSGKLRIPQSIDPASDGLVISNTLDGSARGLRFRNPTPAGEWQTFELVSEARDAREFVLLFELRGLGDVLLDDLKVVAIQPPGAGVRSEGDAAPVAQ